MKRGDFVTIAINGDFGKPRPALIIQSDHFNESDTVTVLLVSSTIVNSPLFRIDVYPDEKNNIQKKSQIMVDKSMTIKREKIGFIFGIANEKTMLEVGRSLALFLGIA